MSNDILNPDYSQMLSVFISETNACAGLAGAATTFSSCYCYCSPSGDDSDDSQAALLQNQSVGHLLGLGSFGFSGGQEIPISWQPSEFHQGYDPIVVEHL